MPDDAFTDDASAKIDDRKLTIRIARRDPQGPAMEVVDSPCRVVFQISCHWKHAVVGSMQEKLGRHAWNLDGRGKLPTVR